MHWYDNDDGNSGTIRRHCTYTQYKYNPVKTRAYTVHSKTPPREPLTTLDVLDTRQPAVLLDRVSYKNIRGSIGLVIEGWNVLERDGLPFHSATDENVLDANVLHVSQALYMVRPRYGPNVIERK